MYCFLINGWKMIIFVEHIFYKIMLWYNLMCGGINNDRRCKKTSI